MVEAIGLTYGLTGISKPFYKSWQNQHALDRQPVGCAYYFLQEWDEMPFPVQEARAFTKEGIEELNPNQFGCYGIFQTGRRWAYIGRAERRWVYIGKGDIRRRLLDNLNGDRPCIQRCSATHFMIMVTADMDNEQERLVLELNPVCKEQSARSSSFSSEQTTVAGR
jgi:hypothetical protein